MNQLVARKMAPRIMINDDHNGSFIITSESTPKSTGYVSLACLYHKVYEYQWPIAENRYVLTSFKISRSRCSSSSVKIPSGSSHA